MPASPYRIDQRTGKMRSKKLAVALRTKKLCGCPTRKGTPCKAPASIVNGRCKMHGRNNTGPRTVEGRARSLAGLRQYRDNQEALAEALLKPPKRPKQ